MRSDTGALDVPVGRLAAERPAAVAVLERLGIDYCCGGNRPLSEVCAARGIAPEALLAEVAAAEEGRESREPSFVESSIAALVVHILRRFHAKLREDLPRLAAMTERVVKAHGPRHPELVMPMAQTFAGIRSALEPHMVMEEDVLFPRLVAQEMRSLAGRPLPPDGTAHATLEAMAAEHDQVGALLARMRDETRGFTPPEDACGTYRGLLAGLAELEEEIHRHVHLENNVLLPAAMELLRSGTSVPTALPVR